MEIAFQDEQARKMCKGKEEKIVELVHANLGLASVVNIQGNGHLLHFETAQGSMLVAPDLSRRLHMHG